MFLIKKQDIIYFRNYGSLKLYLRIYTDYIDLHLITDLQNLFIRFLKLKVVIGSLRKHKIISFEWE